MSSSNEDTMTRTPSPMNDESVLVREQAAGKIQTLARRVLARRRLECLRKTKKLESLRKLKAARDRRKKLNTAAIVIQALVRGAQQRPKYREALTKHQQVGGIQHEIQLLKEKLVKTEQERKQAVQEAEERVAQAMKEVEDSQSMTGMDQAEVEQISMRARLDESEKVLDFLRKERQRIMALVKMHKGRCDRIVEQEHKPLQESMAEVRARMGEVEEYMEILENNITTLAKNKETFERQIGTYRKEIQKAQAYRRNEEEMGKLYQAAVERIVNLVQEQSDQDELVEDLYLLALECGDITLDGGDDAVLGDDTIDDLSDLEFPMSELEAN